MIHLATLGTIQLQTDDGRDLTPVLNQPKRLALLTYLAVEGARSFVRRDALLAMFWPETDDGHAMTALRKALYFLRRHLGADVVWRRGDGDVGVNPAELENDVGLFRRAVDADDHDRAGELYQGEFLRAFSLRDAPDFERWIDTTRAELRRKAAGALRTIAERETHRANAPDAFSPWQRLVDLDPYDTDTVMAFAKTLAQIGRAPHALRVIDEHAARLKSELCLEPNKALARLADEIRNGHAPEPPSVQPNGTTAPCVRLSIGKLRMCWG